MFFSHFLNDNCRIKVQIRENNPINFQERHFKFVSKVSYKQFLHSRSYLELLKEVKFFLTGFNIDTFDTVD